MLRGFVLAAVLETDERVLAEWHHIAEKETIGGFDFVFLAFGLGGFARAGGMANERKRHVLAAPIVAAAAPFFGASALGLRGLAVVEEKSRVTFESVENRAVGENPGRAHELTGPIATAFGFARVEQDEILARFRVWMIAISSVEIAHL